MSIAETAGKETSVRQARPEDYSFFTALVPELGIPDDPIPDFTKFAREVMPGMQVAEREGRPVGYVFARSLVDVTHLMHVVSAPSARRTGVGRALVEAARATARRAGSKFLALAVKRENAAAIALYESCGLAVTYPSKALRLPWSAIDGLPPERTPFVADAREVTPEDDAELEEATGLLRGILAQRRTSPGWVLRRIGRRTVAAFDPTFPGATPFRAADLPHALSLLRALRPFARPADDAVRALVDENTREGEAVAEGLLGMGAEVLLDVLHMRGPVE